MPEDSSQPAVSSPTRRVLAALGAPLVELLDYAGGLAVMSSRAGMWAWRSIVLRRVRFGRRALYAQIVRLGVLAVGVNLLVSGCIGVILALQMAPPLEEFGQTEKVSNIIAIAIFRELGPLISAIVLTGFAGASIAAELGTMVVGEEVEALEAHALNPVRFLVLPRILATIISTVSLCIMGSWMSVASGWLIGVKVLDIPSRVYISNSIDQLKLTDLYTGLWKAAVFGTLIGAIACYNGLKVTGGAAGVGKATTNTVVHSIVTIIFADLIFTAVFYKLGWT